MANPQKSVWVIEYHSESGDLPNPEVIAVFDNKQKAQQWGNSDRIKARFGHDNIIENEDDFEYPCLLLRCFTLNDEGSVKS